MLMRCTSTNSLIQYLNLPFFSKYFSWTQGIKTVTYSFFCYKLIKEFAAVLLYITPFASQESFIELWYNLIKSIDQSGTFCTIFTEIQTLKQMGVANLRNTIQIISPIQKGFEFQEIRNFPLASYSKSVKFPVSWNFQ